MPMLLTEGDLLAEPLLPAIAHGCNCRGSMSGGIAAAIAARFPGLEEAYAGVCERGEFSLGDVLIWPSALHPGATVVFNLATQEQPGPDARLSAVAAALARTRDLCEQMSIFLLGAPQIGAGIGGLRWDDVRSTMSEIFDDPRCTTTLVVAERFVAGRPLPIV